MARLPRETLDRTAATLDGEPVRLLELPVELGEMLGLEAGDVVRVGPARRTDEPAARGAAPDEGM